MTTGPSARGELLEEALRALTALQRRLDQAQRELRGLGRHAPIAIVGMACRAAGPVDGIESLWQVLDAGGDVIREVPADRWDGAALHDPSSSRAGRMVTRSGGFLDDVGSFDAAFFGMSPREAAVVDPQQRLLLEVTWEALEHAGLPPATLRGSRTGVYVGIMGQDAVRRQARLALEDLDAHHSMGTDSSFAAGRVSYLLGARGPSLAVNTACSSSLVAVHLATQALRHGECELAIAGGVHLNLSPDTSVMLSRAGALSRDGRCHAFDAAADGFGRGEGAGVVVLKRLPEAVADGDRVLAVIRGSAVNHDGPSGGLTIPSGPAQQALLRAALQSAGLEPSEVDHVEAHGTGTILGDPIELGALGEVFASGREPGNPLLVTSLKANLGHLEAAAGIVGLIKVVLALQAERIPLQARLTRPNPHVSWDRLPLRVPSESVPWPRGARRRRAGVSSFGMSGANAHVILEEAPEAEDPPQAPRPVDGCSVLTLSARDADGLRRLAGLVRRQLAGVAQESLQDLARSSAVRRTHHVHRMAVVFGDRAELEAGLDAFLDGRSHPGLHLGTAAETAARPAPEGDSRRSVLEAAASRHVRGTPVDWASLLGKPKHFVSLPASPWSRQRLDAPPATPRPADAGDRSLRRQLLQQPAPLREVTLADHIRRVAAGVLRLDPADPRLGDRVGFQDMGVDSILGVEILAQVGADIGRSIPETVLFEHPSIAALARFLARDEAPSSVEAGREAVERC